MAKKRKPKERWVEIDLDPPPAKEPKPRPMEKVKPFHREISLNAGHDWVGDVPGLDRSRIETYSVPNSAAVGSAV